MLRDIPKAVAAERSERLSIIAEQIFCSSGVSVCIKACRAWYSSSSSRYVSTVADESAISSAFALSFPSSAAFSISLKSGLTPQIPRTPDSKIKVWVVPTNEELVIARDTKQIVENNPKDVEELLQQPSISDSSKTVKDVLTEKIAKIGENLSKLVTQPVITNKVA